MAHTCGVVSSPSPAIFGGPQDRLDWCLGESLFVFGDLRCVGDFVVTVRDDKSGHTGMTCMEAGRSRLVGAAVLLTKDLKGIVRVPLKDIPFSLRGDLVGCPLLQEPGMHDEMVVLPPLVTGLRHM